MINIDSYDGMIKEEDLPQLEGTGKKNAGRQD